MNNPVVVFSEKIKEDAKKLIDRIGDRIEAKIQNLIEHNVVLVTSQILSCMYYIAATFLGKDDPDVKLFKDYMQNPLFFHHFCQEVIETNSKEDPFVTRKNVVEKNGCIMSED